MKRRISFDRNMKRRLARDGKIPIENVIGVAFVANFAWFVTTILIHDLLKRALSLPADAGYRDGPEDMMAAVMLPLVIPIAPVVVAALFGVEIWWQNQRTLRARLGYCAVSLALLFWCWWNLKASLSYGYQNRFYGYRITDTVQAAAYASLGFPLAVACACLLLAVLRRAAPPA